MASRMDGPAMKGSLRRLPILFGFAVAALLLAAGSSRAAERNAAASADVLRVCADPDYMPFSNRAGQGFENKIAEFLAKVLGRKLEYHWAGYRGHGGFSNFLALNLDAKKCDLVIDLPYGDIVEGYTSPYYISSYVFITKKGEPPIRSMRAPALRNMKIGFEAGTAPEMALKVTGLTGNAVPFHVADNPSLSPKSLLQAVADGKVGVMITWEPAIGYFLKDYPDLVVTRVPNESEGPGLPALRFTFAMAMGVRKGDRALKDALDSVIKKEKPQLDAILADYGIKLYPSLGG
jgi:mxaJ protein